MWANGKQSDGGIYNRSNFKMHLDNGELNLPQPRLFPGSLTRGSAYHIVGDDAFGLSTSLMKPFPSAICGSLQEKVEMRIFDYR